MIKRHALLALILVASLASCESNRQSKSSEKIGFNQFSQDQIENVIFPTYQKMTDSAIELDEEIHFQCQKKDLNQIDRSKMKDFFEDVIKAYHFSEAFHIGPLEPTEGERSSYELFNQVNWWPDDRRVKIDIELGLFAQDANHKFDNSGYIDGIPTLEYMIYDENLKNACAYLGCGGVIKGWDQLSQKRKIETRCELMKFASKKLVAAVKEVQDSWAPVDGKHTLSNSFKKTITSRDFATKLTLHLGFLENKILNAKVGVPSGYLVDLCGDAGCPDKGEYRYSNLSLISIEHSLKGFLAVLFAAKTDDRYEIKSKGRGYNRLVSQQDRGTVDLLEKHIRFMLKQLKKFDKNTGLNTLVENSAKNYDPFDPYFYQEDCRASTSKNRIIEACALYADLETVTQLFLTELIPAIQLGKPKPASGDPD